MRYIRYTPQSNRSKLIILYRWGVTRVEAADGLGGARPAIAGVTARGFCCCSLAGKGFCDVSVEVGVHCTSLPLPIS